MAQPTLLDSKTIYELERQKVQEKLAPHQNPAAVAQAQTNVAETKQAAQQPGDKPQEKQPSKAGEWLKDASGKIKQTLGTNIGAGFGIGASAMRDIASAVKGQPQGNVMDANATGAKATAQEIQNTATQQQMAAQRSQQIADRNPYTEAGKMASVQNDAQNRQNVRKSGVLGAGAALARSTNAPDVQSQQARQDSQQGMANEMNTVAGQSREEATSGFADANTFAMKSRDFNNDFDQSSALANGRGAGGGQPAQDTSEQENEVDYANDDKFNEWAKSKGYKLVDSNGEPVRPPSDARVKNIEGFAAHFDKCLSDFRMKRIREGFDNGEMCSEDDWNWLCSRAGKFNAGDREWGPDDKGYDNSVLDGYANYIKNYVYTYKPEATQIDQSIDPNEEHIGPMAQDIEQVNPACIKETPEGVKTVDTGRLSMMNAGAIADLAREVKEINEKFAQLGI